MNTTSETLTFNYRPSQASRSRAKEQTFATTEAVTEPRDWGYVGLFAFTLVLLLRPQDRVPALTSIHIAEVCAFLGIGPMLMHRFARRLPVFRVTPETLGLTLFGAAILITAPFSVWPSGALQVFTDSYVKIMIVFVLMMNTLTTTARLERLMTLILLCIGFISALGVMNYASGSNLVEGGRLAGPVGGIFGNPNDLALNMVTFLPAAIVVALSSRQPALKRAVAAGIAVLMFATIVFTKSRGGLLGLLAALAVLLVMARGWMRSVLAVLAIVGAVAVAPMLPASFWDRMTTIVDEAQDKQFTGSREARQLVMTDGINTFLEFPFTGVGAGQFKNYNPPERKTRWLETHNVLIQVAAETGLFGLLAFLFLIVRAFMAALATRRLMRDPAARALSEHTLGLTAGLVGWFVCALFASVAYNWTFYYVLALLVAARQLAFDQVRAAVPAKLKTMSIRTPALSTQTAT
jgi:O-antigen ligase